jgi:cytochrome c5
MRKQANSSSRSAGWPAPLRRLGAGLPLLLVLCALAVAPASAQRKERQGKEVVDAVCGACHATGANGAPKIGDQKAWAPRASQGLTALTDHAIKGIRNMPAHGGSAGVSDIEIERAITYMVNQSGGHWVEPVGGATPAVLRGSEQIVQSQCAKCHQTGVDGAPKIGDRDAWIQRLKKGLDPLVASAIHGHGAMPARGGLPDLSDQEVRGAILYMFNYGIAAPPTPAKAEPASPFHRVVAGTDVYLGMISAEALRKAQAEGRNTGAMHGGIPSGKGYYHLNISLADSKTNVSISDAEVSVRVSDMLGAETRNLELMAENNAVSYGNFFQLTSGNTYTIGVQIRRPGVANPIETRFEFKAP